MVGNKVVYDDSFENVLSKTALTNSDKDYGLQSDLTRMEVTEEGMPTSTTLYGTMAFAGKDGSNMLANCAGNGCYLGYCANSDGSLKDSYKNGNQTSYPVYIFDSNSLLW